MFYSERYFRTMSLFREKLQSFQPHVDEGLHSVDTDRSHTHSTPFTVELSMKLNRNLSIILEIKQVDGRTDSETRLCFVFVLDASIR